MPTLQDAGFRFIFMDDTFKWCHPSEIPAGASDCTDMSDEEFHNFAIQRGRDHEARI